MDVVKSSYSFNYLEDGIMKFPDAMKAYMFIDVARELVEGMSWEKAHKDEWLMLIEGLETVEYDGFVDLGLPSGTKWKRINEDENDYFTFDEALKEFGKKTLPGREDFQELIDHCKSEWDGTRKGRIFTGPNGQSIFIPALGYRKKDGSTVAGRGSNGGYWSSSISDEENACSLCFGSDGVYTAHDYRYYGNSVRLVQK